MKRIVLSLVIGVGIFLGLFSASTHAGPPPALDCSTATNITVPVAECQALVDLYSITNGGSWSSRGGRNTDTNVCTWAGVSCTNISGQNRVTGLNLKSFGLKGELPDSMSALDQITSFQLGNNILSGDLPAAWSTWINITDFAIANNDINGSLPSSWSSWINIQSFNVGNNEISGSLPIEWSTWININFFTVARNQISGLLPTTWSTWINLTQFQISSNQISGTLPITWSTWSMIEGFDARANEIEGSLPVAWSAWSQIQNFNISSNQISGPLPTSWSTWTNITNFEAYENQINGHLPDTWSTWIIIEWFDINTNLIGGEIPISWTTNRMDMGSQYLDVTYNCLTIDLPGRWVGTNVSYDPQEVCDSVDLFVTPTLINPINFSPGDLIGYIIEYGNFGPFDAINVVIKSVPGHGLSITEASLAYTTDQTGFGQVGDVCYDELVATTSGPYADAFNDWAVRVMGESDFQTVMEQQMGWNGGAQRGSFLIGLVNNALRPFTQFVMDQLGVDITQIQGCGTPGQYDYIFSFRNGISAGETGQIILTGQVALSGFEIDQDTLYNTISISSDSTDINGHNNSEEILARLFIPEPVIDAPISPAPSFGGGGRGGIVPTPSVDSLTSSRPVPTSSKPVPTPSLSENKIPDQNHLSCLYENANYTIDSMTDIPKAGATRNAIIALLQDCVVQGQYGKGEKFGTYDKITYGEVYKIVVRSLGLEYNMGNKGHRALPYKVTARQNALLDGTNMDANFDTVATKEDIITLLNNVRMYKGLSKTFNTDTLNGQYVLRGRFALIMSSLLQ